VLSPLTTADDYSVERHVPVVLQHECWQAVAIPHCVSPRQVANPETIHVDSDGVGIVRILRLWQGYGNKLLGGPDRIGARPRSATTRPD
jgi:hypothetical protein